ncbi:unnamed protein product [Ceutorhynchus assimilis]|uniref:CRAL-TRIO domain-containing protein n=1 Tax=Ceutorhynchus assimilis TaxID=467358 RepID=A0A9N9MWV8_9CUCU|nr:unnamed protein product [Ceutorhynchus assimilis]
MPGDFLEVNEPLYYEQLFKEFGKTKEDVEDFINILKQWADSQPHFPEKPAHHTLRFAILYNKFSIEKAKQKLDMYYTIRNLMPEYFRTNPFTAEMVFQRKVWFLVPLPKVTGDHIRILYHKLNPEYLDPKYFSHEKFIILFIQLVEYLLREDLCFRFHYICDCAGWSIGHGTGMSPMALKKATVILEKVFSNRLASFYMVNFPPFMETIVNSIIKPILVPKIRNRLKISASQDVLLEVFGKEILPTDLGGEEKSAKELNDMLSKKYEEHKDMYLKLEKLSVDETLRPAKLRNDDILGYYGNFKKINVD